MSDVVCELKVLANFKLSSSLGKLHYMVGGGYDGIFRLEASIHHRILLFYMYILEEKHVTVFS